MNEQTNGTNGSVDDRGAYRIEDEMELRYRLATPEEIANPNLDSDTTTDGKRGLLRALASLDADTVGLLSMIGDKYKEISIYLKIIDHKIKILAETVCAEESGKNEPQTVNISESGIAFTSDTPFREKDILRLHMILRPNFHDIPAYAEVVKCKKIDSPKPHEKTYFLATNFTHMLNMDRQALARHIMKRQAEIRKKLKEEEF